MQTLITPVASIPPLNAAIARGRAKRDVPAPLVLKLTAVSILLPDEIGFHVAGLWFSPTRLIFFGLTPVVLMRFGRMLAAGRYRFVWSDLFVLLTGLWMFVALGKIDGIEDALKHAGPLALEFCVGYLAARFLLSEHGQAVSFIIFLCWAIVFVALLGLADTLTNRFFLHDLVAALIGPKQFLGGPDHRFGLARATSTLEHPILYGITCSVGLLLATSVPIRRLGFAIFSCGLGTLLALSSAPLQGAVMGFGLLIYNRVLASIPLRWAGLIGLATAGMVMMFTFLDNPFSFIFNHLVFDTESAYFRLWTWQMAGAALDESPWFGVGFVTPDIYDIPNTVDSFWLASALQFGIPGSLLFALSIIGAASLPTNGPRVRLTALESKLGTTLGIVIFLIVFLGFTVDFFGTAWILIPLLAGVRAHLGELGRRHAEAS